MTIACVVHWYESLLFLAPVAMTVGAIGVSEKVLDAPRGARGRRRSAPCRTGLALQRRSRCVVNQSYA
jgi:hypothetical protein